MGEQPDIPFKIKLIGPVSTDFSNYMVGATIHIPESSSEISIGIFQTSKYEFSTSVKNNPYFINYKSNSFNQSNSDGEVSFFNLSVIDCSANSVSV